MQINSLSDRDMEEDNQILATLLKQIPSCKTVSDIDQLLQDIPVQPPVVVLVRTVQEAVAAGDLPPLDVDAANVFSLSERFLQEHVGKHYVNAVELKDLIQRVLHHPDFNADEVDHDMHERLMKAVEDGDIEVIDMWEEDDGLQDNIPSFYRKGVPGRASSQACLPGCPTRAAKCRL